MSKVLITGAGGFLGTWMTRKFLDAGHTVCAADLARVDMSGHKGMGAETVACDVTDKASIEAAMSDVDIVIHAAGIFDLSAPPEVLWAVNREGARAVAEVAADQGVKRFVMISSSSVYGRNVVNCTEDAPKRPDHVYGRSKWAGEEAAVETCKERGVPFTVLRPTLIYGPGGRYGVANALALLALRAQNGLSRLPIAEGGPFGHHVHVEDVARAAVALSTDERAAGGVFNVSDDAPLTCGDLIRIFGEATGVAITTPALPWWMTRMFGIFKPMLRWFFARENGKLSYLWSKLADRLGITTELQPRIDIDWVDFIFLHHSFDNHRVKALGFEFQHPDSRAGLRETVVWYKQNGWLPTIEGDGIGFTSGGPSAGTAVVPQASSGSGSEGAQPVG